MANETDNTPHDPAIPEWALPLITNPSDCVRQRLFGLLVVRFVGFLILLAATIPVLSWFIEGVSDGDLLDLSYYAGRIGFAIALGFIGLGFLLAAGPISRKLVVVHREPRCPGCGFNLTGLIEPRCPECALRFTESSGVQHPHHTTIQYRTWLFAAVLAFRLVAVVLLGWGMSTLLDYLWWVVDDWEWLYYPFLGMSEFFSVVVMVASAVLPWFLLWWLAPMLARMCLRSGLKTGLKAGIEPDEPTT